MINIHIKSLLDKYSKYHLVKHLPSGSVLLDVGCGNFSASKMHALNKNIIIDGIDITEYNISDYDKKIMRNYFIVEPHIFSDTIKAIPQDYNAIICSHVLEHVKDYPQLLATLFMKVKTGGLLYLSFPAQNTVSFPHRKGTLNFWDDDTHVAVPDPGFIMEIAAKNNFSILKYAIPNKGYIKYMLGLFMEPFSRVLNKVLPFTWYYWGFENILILKKQPDQSYSA